MRVEERKLVPELRFASFDGEWSHQLLGTVTQFKRGFDLPSNQRKPGIYPIVSSSGYTGYHHKFKVSGPGIVTGRYGSIGEVFYVEEDHWPLNTSLWVEDFYKNEIPFIYQLLHNVRFDLLSDKTGVPGVNRNDLHCLKTSIPSLPEQRKIADFLTAVDGRIQQLIQKKSLLEDYKKGAMQQLFTQAIRFKDDHGNDFPEWEERRYDAVYSFKNTNSYSRDLLTYEGGQVRNIHYGDIHTKFVTIQVPERLLA